MQKPLLHENFEFIDLTHVLTPDIPHWDTGCGFKLAVTLNYDKCTTDVKFRVQQVSMAAGIGTHMDAPAHCISGAKTIDKIPLEQLIAPCVVINVSDKTHEKYSVSVNDIKDFEEKYGRINSGTFVIIYTGWDKFWQQPEKYRNNLIFPCVSKEAAELLLQREIVGLGIDTLSPDRSGEGFPVHNILLSAGKYIVENVNNANKLPPVGANVFVMPIKIQDGTEAPVRLIGLVERKL